jgi:ribosomal protein S18 acetylase RimI-like enzyme
MVDPEFQGSGVGRRLLTTTLRSLRGAGEPRIYLNVTEGNEPALRLYRRLGFVRSLGPTRDWYNALRIPFAPSPDA